MTLDEGYKQTLEPYSSSIEERCKALETLKKEGISTYCSIEPIMPEKESNPFEIIKRLSPFVDLFELGKWSPYIKKGVSENYSEDYYINLFKQLIPFCQDMKVHYCIASHSEELLKEHGIRFISHQLVTDRPYPIESS